MTLITSQELADKRLKDLGITPNAIHVRGQIGGLPYAKVTKEGHRAYLWASTWTPEELRAIADHLEANQ